MIPLGLNCLFNRNSAKKSSLHQFGTKMIPRIFFGYALNSGGGWTRDLIIANWHDIENNVASENHVKRFKSKGVGVEKRNDELVFLCANGSLKQERSVPHHSERQRRSVVGDSDADMDSDAGGHGLSFVQGRGTLFCRIQESIFFWMKVDLQKITKPKETQWKSEMISGPVNSSAGQE